MHPAVELLQGLMAPPPEGGDAIDWDRVAADSGMRFPADYRDFVAVFGGGSIDDYLAIHTPPIEDSWLSGLLGWTSPFLDEWHLRHLGELVTDPEQHQMFGVGDTPTGDDVMWPRGSTDPDEWKILVRARHPIRDTPWTFFDGGFVEFLVALIRGELDDPLAVRGFPAVPPRYIGWREWQANLMAME